MRRACDGECMTRGIRWAIIAGHEEGGAQPWERLADFSDNTKISVVVVCPSGQRAMFDECCCNVYAILLSKTLSIGPTPGKAVARQKLYPGRTINSESRRCSSSRASCSVRAPPIAIWRSRCPKFRRPYHAAFNRPRILMSKFRFLATSAIA